MRSTVSFLVVLAACWAGSSGSALAEAARPGSSNVSVDDESHAQNVDDAKKVSAEHRRGLKSKEHRRGRPAPLPAEVPELDPNAAGLALMLLAGGALLFVDRRCVQA